MLQDNVKIGLTFDDLLLLPAKSGILPPENGAFWVNSVPSHHSFSTPAGFVTTRPLLA